MLVCCKLLYGCSTKYGIRLEVNSTRHESLQKKKIENSIQAQLKIQINALQDTF